MKTHVFIVDITTFKYHLEYLFAGTGAKDYVIDFNNLPNTSLNSTRENLLCSMIADLERIRIGDFIVFYLQQNPDKNVREGKFYGIFKVKSNPFLDNNDKKQFLMDKLEKSLTFRILLEPYEIYEEGVSEWEALDEIKNIKSPNQMLWSLIYRKLKGNRGNTMITIYEAERLFKLIRDKNNKTFLNGDHFSFDISNQKIISIDIENKYTGRQENINILPRLIQKLKEKKAFEAHLQAYIIQNIGKNINISLDKTILGDFKDYKIEWLGNEVSCGVGMQRIDIMLSLSKSEDKRVVMPIELKAVEYSDENLIQIQRYIDWLEQYYITNRISDILPILITKKSKKGVSKEFKQKIKEFNVKNKTELKFIEYDLNGDNLDFQITTY